ncbi:MAG: hypothetical protein EZS28_018845 [Streblomastix strix]|uniref:Uncharacterized protein n=1 Tax=Streblomastix strix TaxID=222440 RepID=A0A5J4VSP3_9EUKA|nr:MAG: hypothetical protein EZS28_018845 [Streblomastix strix]
MISKLENILSVEGNPEILITQLDQWVVDSEPSELTLVDMVMLSKTTRNGILCTKVLQILQILLNIIKEAYPTNIRIMASSILINALSSTEENPISVAIPNQGDEIIANAFGQIQIQNTQNDSMAVSSLASQQLQPSIKSIRSKDEIRKMNEERQNRIETCNSEIVDFEVEIPIQDQDTVIM